MVWGLRFYSIFFSIFSCSAWSTWLDRCISPTGITRLNKTRVPPPVVLRFLTPYALASSLKNLFLWNLSILSIPFASPSSVFYLTPCLPPPPPPGSRTKRQVSKRLVSKRPVLKRQVYKKSGLHNVRFQNVWFQNVRFQNVFRDKSFKTSVFLNLIYVLNKKYRKPDVLWAYHPPPTPSRDGLMRLSLFPQVPGLWVLHLRLGRAHPEQYEPWGQGGPHERRLSQGEIFAFPKGRPFCRLFCDRSTLYLLGIFVFYSTISWAYHTYLMGHCIIYFLLH